MDFTHMAIKKIKKVSRAIIKDIKKSEVVATGEKFIDVIVWIYEGTKKVDVKKLGYPFNTPRKEIVEDVKKHIRLRDASKKRKEEQAIVDKEEKEADKTVNGLKDLEIK